MTGDSEQFQERTILVVDDQPSVCVSLQFLLTGAGYRVLTAGSGSTAIALTEREPIDGALIDVHMPVMNGLDTCLGLQAQAHVRGLELRVWFITGAFVGDLERRSAAMGAFGVLRKPFDSGEFLARLDREFALPIPSASPATPAISGDRRNAAVAP